MKLSLIRRFSFPTLALLLPTVTSAQNLQRIVDMLFGLFNNLVVLFILVAVVVFFWGLIKYLWSMSQESAHEGLKIMFWGLIAIFVMVSIWGLIRLLQGTLGVSDTERAMKPSPLYGGYQIPSPGGGGSYAPSAGGGGMTGYIPIDSSGIPH